MRSIHSDTLDPIDIYIGQRLHTHRLRCGFILKHVGDQVGLKLQQIARYEHGAGGIKCARLFQIAAVLGAPPGAFFPGGGDSSLTPEEQLWINRPDTIRLLRAFSGVSGDRRTLIIEMVEAYANERYPLKRSGGA